LDAKRRFVGDSLVARGQLKRNFVLTDEISPLKNNFMSIFWFVVGIACGFGAKLGADKYGEWKNHEKQQREQLGDWLVELRAIQKLKKERETGESPIER